MTDLYYEIRSDLAVLETLICVGDISVKSLLYESSLLITCLRKHVRDKGSLQLWLRDTLKRNSSSNGIVTKPSLCMAHLEEGKQ